jgi:hypothetical protein
MSDLAASVVANGYILRCTVRVLMGNSSALQRRVALVFGSGLANAHFSTTVAIDANESTVWYVVWINSDVKGRNGCSLIGNNIIIKRSTRQPLAV